MKKLPTRLVAAAAAALVLTMTGCAAGGGSPDSGSSDKNTTITFWSSQQAPTIQATEQALRPELDRFTKETGITVKLEVIEWANLTNRTLTAASTGVGPDVISLGNSNATTFQATGAFMPWGEKQLDAIGGGDRFVPASLRTGGPAGEPRGSVPWLAQAYALYYNKKIFAEHGLKPPTTWDQVVSDAKAVTDPAKNQWGLTIPGALTQESMHMSFIFGTQSGGHPFDAKGNPTFADGGMIDGIQRYVDLIGKDGVVNPADAQITDPQKQRTNFVNGNSAMLLGQNLENSLVGLGMSADDFGLVPFPAPSPLPKGGQNIGSFVGGINLAVFKNTKHQDAALKLVKFLTSEPVQERIDVPFGAMPVNKNGKFTYTDNEGAIATYKELLSSRVTTFPLVPTFSGFTANVGAAVVGLVAQAATGTDPTRSDIKNALTAAQQKFEATN